MFGIIADGDQPRGPVQHLLPTHPEREFVVIPQVERELHVNEELVHVEPILVDWSWAALAPAFQAALELAEHADGAPEMQVGVEEIALKKVPVVVR